MFQLGEKMAVLIGRARGLGESCAMLVAIVKV